MVEKEEHLIEVFENLIRLNRECSCNIVSECGASEMTVRQITYLKTIDQQGEVTFSTLAGITSNSKPTITGMIDKFVKMDCAYRERCPDDGRIQYIRLTDKGRKIAKADEFALRQLVERMVASLDEDELDFLIGVLRKVR